jgi:hypothetical protein
VRSLRLAVLALTWTLIATGHVSAESKWSFKRMMPSFTKKESPPRGLYPKSSQPSMWSRMNKSTKNAFAKTKQMVPSWLMPETQAKAKRSSDVARGSATKIRDEVRTARRNILAPWGPKEQAPEKPRTVSDFLGQDRPE